MLLNSASVLGQRPDLDSSCSEHRVAKIRCVRLLNRMREFEPEMQSLTTAFVSPIPHSFMQFQDQGRDVAESVSHVSWHLAPSILW